MMTAMTKLLEQAIAKVRGLPDEDQEAIAAVMLTMARADAPVVRLDDETRAAIREGDAQARRGEFVPDEVIAQADKRHGVVP
jgi:hypothetical protein